MYKVVDREEVESAETLTNADYVRAIEKNRDRIRVLSHILTQLGGALLSGSLVVLFFMLNEISQPAIVPIVAMFVSSFVLFVATGCAIYASYVHSPRGAADMGRKLQNELILFHKERRWVLFSIFFMFFAILVFFGSLVHFSVLYALTLS